MTPVEIRLQFNETIRYYRACWSNTETSCKAARMIVGALQAYPWLRDQIPNDIHDMARREVAGLPPVAA